MPPPALPFFSGRTITAREEPTRWSTPLLALKPREKHSFTEPRGTSALYLPPEHIVSVSTRPLADGAWSQVEFHGTFRRVDRPPHVTLGPIATDDVPGLLAALGARYGLPRLPLDVSKKDLARVPSGRFVSVVGAYTPGHFEGPNFGDMHLELVDELEGTLVPGRVYRATGFWHPALPQSPNVPPAIGFTGSRIATVAVSDPLFSYPYTLSRGERFEAYLGGDDADGALGEHGLAFRSVGPTGNFVMLVEGVGGQRTGNWAIDAMQQVVRGSFERADESVSIDGAVQYGQWVEQSVVKGALPMDIPGMLDAIAARFGATFEALEKKGYALGGSGVLAYIDGTRASILRYGLSRVYLVRAGIVYLIVPEHTYGVAVGEQAALLPNETRHIALSMFGMKTGDRPTPMSLDVYAGDRLVFLCGQAIAHRVESSIHAALLEPALSTVVRRIREAGEAIPRDKWAIATLSNPS